MRKSRIIGGIVAALFVGGAGAAFAIAWRPAIAAIDPPAPQSFDTGTGQAGRYLAAIGNCNDCHTVRGGKSFCRGSSGADAVRHDLFLQHHAGCGDGDWPVAGTAFRRAMRSGVNRDGQHLYPTFPYDHFTNVTDADDQALYAYLMTRQPVRAPARENELFLSTRSAVCDRRLEAAVSSPGNPTRPDSTQSAEWKSRRPIWSKGWRHCGSCHTRAMHSARNVRAAQFAGGDVDNWHAYAINAQSPAPVPWDADALFAYLRDGWHPDHGVARGPMAEVVKQSVIGAARRYPLPSRPIWPACSARRRGSQTSGRAVLAKVKITRGDAGRHRVATLPVSWHVAQAAA